MLILLWTGPVLLSLFAWLAAMLPVVAETEDDSCLAAPYEAVETDAQREVLALIGATEKSVEGFASLGAALRDERLVVCVSDRLFSELAYLDAEQYRIVLSRSMGTGLRQAVFLHELRHLDQLRLGACPGPELSMQEYARAVFANEADANAITLLVAWDQKNKGNPSLWEALTAWTSTADIAARFEVAMNESADPAEAAAAAFEAWYGSEARRERYYVSTCSAYLDRQDRLHTLPSYDSVGPGYFTTLCTMPDGAAYPCAEPEGAGRR